MASNPPPSDRLAAWLATQRWFGGKHRRIRAVDVDDAIALDGGTLFVLRAVLDDGDVQRYVAPLQAGTTPADALDDARFTRAMLDLVRSGGHAGALHGQRTRAFPDELDGNAAVRKIGGEQSNTSIVVGEAVILKHFRRLAPGLNPDLEITRFLTETASFAHTPELAGWLEYAADGGEPATLAVVQRLVTGARDGWEWMLGAMGDERARGQTVPALRRLGEITAQLHLALARAPATLPAMAPEPVTDGDIARWAAAVTTQLAAARAAAPAADIPTVAPDRLRDALATLRGRMKARHHGDFHLGQTLYRAATGAWTIIDFEGEPLRPMAERRQKHAPLRDVAGLLRSIAYAAETARTTTPGAWIDAWEREARAAFLDGYLTAAGRAPFLPDDVASTLRVVAAFELEKAAYEVVYEANNRPDWIAIPLRGVVSAAAALRPSRAAGAA
jgi:trehalose synthase-fused probable maltokinase